VRDAEPYFRPGGTRTEIDRDSIVVSNLDIDQFMWVLKFHDTRSLHGYPYVSIEGCQTGMGLFEQPTRKRKADANNNNNNSKPGQVIERAANRQREQY